VIKPLEMLFLRFSQNLRDYYASGMLIKISSSGWNMVRVADALSTIIPGSTISIILFMVYNNITKS
jgi:hypothetical protein